MRQNSELAWITRSQAPRSSGERFCERTPSASNSFGSIAATTLRVISSCSAKTPVSSPVVTIGPDVVSGGGVYQLRRDAHAVTTLSHAAFQHVANAELARGAFHVDCFALIRKRRVARDYEKPAQLRQPG